MSRIVHMPRTNTSGMWLFMEDASSIMALSHMLVRSIAGDFSPECTGDKDHFGKI
jgi:hypothetical protein